jgi:hypothetical protein
MVRHMMSSSCRSKKFCLRVDVFHGASDPRGVVTQFVLVGVAEVASAVVRAVPVDELELEGVVRELECVGWELVGVLRGFLDVVRAWHDVVLAAEGVEGQAALARVQSWDSRRRGLLGGDESLVVGGEVGVVALVLDRFIRVDLGLGEDVLGAELPGRRARSHGDFYSEGSLSANWCANGSRIVDPRLGRANPFAFGLTNGFRARCGPCAGDARKSRGHVSRYTRCGAPEV